MAENPTIIDIDQLRANPSAGTFDSKTLEMLLQLQLQDQAEKAQERIKEKQRLQESKSQMRQAIEEQARKIKMYQDACTHTLPKGENAISGQVHNDGKFHGICVVCQKQFRPRDPKGEEMRTVTADFA